MLLKNDKRDKEARWVLLKSNWYAQYQACAVCNEQRYCAGKRKDKLVCHECFVSV